MATTCPGCPHPQRSSGDHPSFEPPPNIDWPDLYSLHCSTASRESFCEAIDQHEAQLNSSIEALKNTVIHLRALRNTRSSILQLPPELLIHIFSYLACASHPPSSSNVVASTHVCRHWRAVALDTPALWTNIVGDNISRTEAFIQRSKKALLDVDLIVGAASPPANYLKTVVLHDRLRSLTLAAPRGNLEWLQNAAISIACLDAPYLTTLHLLGMSNHGTYTYPRPALRPITVYGQREDEDRLSIENSPTPALRSLRLRPSFLSWYSSIYRNLHVLDVTAYQHHLDPVKEQRILDILRQCPQLVELRLCLGADFVDPDAPSADRNGAIALPLLSVLSLEEFTPECVANFLSHLALPPCTRYNFSLDVEDPHDSPYFPKVFPDDLSLLPGLAEIRTVWIEITSKNTVRLYPTGVDLGEPAVKFVLSDNDDRFILALPGNILDATEKLIFSTPRRYGDGFSRLCWPELFNPALRLRTVRLVRPDLEDVVEAMRALAESIFADSPPPCPELECLELAGKSFDEYDRERVEDAVRRRGRAGFPLRRLILEDIGGASEEWVSCLRDLGVDVVRRNAASSPPRSVFMDNDSSETSSPSSDF